MSEDKCLVCNKKESITLIGESGLVVKSVVSRVGRFPVQSPIGALPGLETQSRYQAPDEFRVEIDQIAVIKSLRLSLENDPKLAVGQPNSI